MMRQVLFSLAVLSLAACSRGRAGRAPRTHGGQAPTTPGATSSVRLTDGDSNVKAGYRAYSLQGFSVLLSDQTASHAEEAQAVLTRVDLSLADASQRFGSERTARLQTVRVWVEWGDPDKGPRGPAEFHQSRVWLAQHGYDVEKERGIEINDTRVFLQSTATQQPFALLHELAHAYDAITFENENPAITAAYRAALASGRYDAVARTGDSAISRAYALTDEREYFAETTEAYLAINDFFPFAREDLAVADPLGFALMAQVWGGQPALPVTRWEARGVTKPTPAPCGVQMATVLEGMLFATVAVWSPHSDQRTSQQPPSFCSSAPAATTPQPQLAAAAKAVAQK